MAWRLNHLSKKPFCFFFFLQRHTIIALHRATCIGQTLKSPPFSSISTFSYFSSSSSAASSNAIASSHGVKQKAGHIQDANLAAEQSININGDDILSSIQHGELLYARIRTTELLSTLLNLSLVSQDRLVDLSIGLMRSPLMEFAAFRKPLQAAVKRTAYSHFCAGEDVEEASVTLQRMWDLGLKSILDYSLEDAMDNDACDANLHGFLQTVHTTQQLPPGSVSFSCVKVTAICPLPLLERVSALIRWQHMMGEEAVKLPWLDETLPLLAESSPTYHISASPPPSASPSPSPSQSQSQSQSASHSPSATQSHSPSASQLHSPTASPSASQSHSPSLAASASASASAAASASGPSTASSSSSSSSLGWRNYLPPEPLSREEEADLERAKRRMWALCRACEGAELPLLVDAEYTSVQPAIDYLTYNAAMHFNSSAKKKNPKENLKKENLEKDEKPLVYGTVQAYLVDAFPRLRLAAEAAAQRGVSFGVKLVRGAYLSREAALAASLSAPSPILPSIHDTHRNYDACAAYMLHRAASASHGAGSSCVVLATHNAHSGRAAAMKAQSLGIPKGSSCLHFAQLKGMADGLSLALVNAGFPVSKYLPFGPVDHVIPYLIRRAEENRGLLGNTLADRIRIRKELKRRLLQSLSLY